MTIKIVELAVEVSDGQQLAIVNFLRQRRIPFFTSSDDAYASLEQIQKDSYRACKGMDEEIWRPKNV